MKQDRVEKAESVNKLENKKKQKQHKIQKT